MGGDLIYCLWLFSIKGNLVICQFVTVEIHFSIQQSLFIKNNIFVADVSVRSTGDLKHIYK